MIKFFRSIRQNLLNEGKTSKYLKYAIGEIILVVIGILIALQINNGNQNRINKISERLLLKEINAEFKLNKEELESTIRDYVLIRDQCDYLRKYFPIDISQINKDTLARTFHQIRNLFSADLSTGSISTLINTSSFEIISNKELRSLLIQWNGLISDYFEREERALLFTEHTIIPYLAKRIPQPYMDGIYDDRIDLSFLNSIEFENLINDRRTYANTLINIVDSENDEIIKAINRIIFLTNRTNE